MYCWKALAGVDKSRNWTSKEQPTNTTRPARQPGNACSSPTFICATVSLIIPSRFVRVHYPVVFLWTCVSVLFLCPSVLSSTVLSCSCSAYTIAFSHIWWPHNGRCNLGKTVSVPSLRRLFFSFFELPMKMWIREFVTGPMHLYNIQAVGMRRDTPSMQCRLFESQATLVVVLIVGCLSGYACA